MRECYLGIGIAVRLWSMKLKTNLVRYKGHNYPVWDVQVLPPYDCFCGNKGSFIKLWPFGSFFSSHWSLLMTKWWCSIAQWGIILQLRHMIEQQEYGVWRDCSPCASWLVTSLMLTYVLISFAHHFTFFWTTQPFRRSDYHTKDKSRHFYVPTETFNLLGCWIWSAPPMFLSCDHGYFCLEGVVPSVPNQVMWWALITLCLCDCEVFQCVQWHVNCNYIATGSSDKTVRLWDVQSGECMRIFTGHCGMVLSLAMSSDGRYMASGDEDGAILMWDLGSGRCVTPLMGHTGCVWSLTFR